MKHKKDYIAAPTISLELDRLIEKIFTRTGHPTGRMRIGITEILPRLSHY